MSGFRKQNKQAEKKSNAIGTNDFKWRESYNLALLIIPLLGVVLYSSQMNTWLPVKTIQLSSSFQYLDQKKIESTLRAFIGESFFSLDIHRVRKILSDNPWTESVSIRRVWPDKINIEITEKIPVGRWDNTHLLSARADVFESNTTDFGHLPLVYSANTSSQQILSQFYQLQAQFSELDESVVAVRKDSRNSLEIELEKELFIKVGREDVNHKLKRLVSIYRNQFQPRRQEIRLLDLRYSNGIAVSWKQLEQNKQGEAVQIRSNKNV